MPPRKKTAPKTKPPKPVANPAPSIQATSPERPCAVAGFGASAGGLEAFSELLERLPENPGAAFVFIQHLDPRHGSMLRDLLARATKMPVLQAADGLWLRPNHVYVIPPNTGMTLSGGALKVHPRKFAGQHMPIDEFFRSLADECGAAAIGVVLSGTASDGTLGLQAIKAAGGITFAQSPDTAKYDGMPRSALSTGAVDFVLPVHRIAQELVRLLQHPYVQHPYVQRPAADAAEDPTGDRGFDEIFNMLRAATGVDFRHYKPATIRRRTQRRMALLKFDSTAQYVRYLKEQRSELDHLFQDILINVTAFFREAQTFDALTSSVLPALVKDRKADDSLRIWVPGCATGEECYSIAICLLEFLREHRIEIPIQIFGTDLSESALAKARLGIYPDSIAIDVSPDRLRRFFVRVNGAYQISRSVRDTCIFARQNMTKDPPFSKIDIILCRNVMIYLGPALQASSLRLFHYALKPEGVLVLGMSESASAGGELFTMMSKQHRIYRRNPVQAHNANAFGPYELREPRGAPEQEREGPGPPEKHTRVDDLILNRYSPPAVVVDRDLRILQFRGETSPYLRHGSGEASLSLLKMGREGLGLKVRRLVREAEEKNAPVLTEVIPVTSDHDSHKVRVTVHPMRGQDWPGPQFLVVFEPQAGDTPVVKGKPAKKPKLSGVRQQNHELELELASLREHAQSLLEEQDAATEELKSAHEEVQSANEELQSTNEELLTAKEELQSTNEELTTVNEEMQSRNTELQQMNNDLINLLSSMNIPIVMLGNDLRVRRFTPQAEKILNLLPTDVGRSINDFRLKIKVPDLLSLCRDVIETLAATEHEVQDTEGRIYSMWLRPYRTTDHRIDGVVLSLFDITERKQAAEARYRRLFESAKDGIVVLRADTGEILETNPFITQRFGYTRASLVGSGFWETGLFQMSGLNEGLLRDLQEHESAQYTFTAPAASGEPVDVEMIAVRYAEGERGVIQLNLRDVGPRKRVEEKLRRADEEFRQAQKMEAVGRLAGGVAHDFNNLLTAVMGYGELLGQSLQEGHPGRRLVEQIRKAAERAAVLTRRLLAVGRRQMLQRAVLSVAEVVVEIQQLLVVMMRENIELDIVSPPDVGAVMADRGQLEQVVLNLTLNARDAMPDGGRITIEIANMDVEPDFLEGSPNVPPGRYVALTVRDTGIGMSAETQAHLFEPFFTTKPAGTGVGLGLSTVYGIVTQSGGHIRVTSELGAGSAFKVYLPRADAEPEAKEPARNIAVPSGTETILLVEDEPLVRAVARAFLEGLGYQVVEAASGADALRLSREFQGRIDLLLTDVVMPQMSGRDLALQLARERPEMRALYTSGHTENVISHHGVLNEGISFLEKPFTQESLAAKVRAILDGK